MLRKGRGGLYKAPTKEERRQRKPKRREDFNDGDKLYDSGKQGESKTFHKLHVVGMNDDLWDISGAYYYFTPFNRADLRNFY